MDVLETLAEMRPQDRTAFMATLSTADLLALERLTEPLMRFIPRVSPTLKSPYHLRQVVEVFQDVATKGDVRVVLSAPPQHGKTVVVQHALPWLMGRDPRKRNGYVTYAADRAHKVSGDIRGIARAAGIRTTGSRKIWETKQKGGLIATGIGGPLTGFGISGALVIDDPVKNRAEAESTLYRDRNDEWFKDVAYTRVHPGGSIVVVQTRWHEDDLAGRLIKRGWRRINLPAVAVEDDAYRKVGEALWEAERPRAWLDEVRKQVLEHSWWSLYQGEPRPRGGAVFLNATLVKELPNLDKGYQVGIGIDLAYSKKTRADWSVAVVLARSNLLGPDEQPIYYVLEVVRKQCRAPEFKEELQKLKAKYPFAKMRWYAAGPEAGIGDFLEQSDGAVEGLEVEVLPAKTDKFARAQPVAAAWNASRVLVLEDAPWAPQLVGEVTEFTGVNDAHDDDVDALAAAYDLLQPTSDEEHLRRRLQAFLGKR